MKLETVASVDSTSEALKRRAAAGEMGEVALLARQQSVGRGRFERRWESPPGNLYLSALLRLGRVRAPGHWSILSAVVLAETVAALLPDPSAMRLKWPNDVLLGDAKLAGILLEAGDDHGPWLLIGFGVNLATAPDGLDRPTASLAGLVTPPAPETFARDLLARLEAWRARYASEGFEPVRTEWLSRGPDLGERVAATFAGGRRVEGVFDGLASSGGLRLATPTGPRTILAGELF